MKPNLQTFNTMYFGKLSTSVPRRLKQFLILFIGFCSFSTLLWLSYLQNGGKEWIEWMDWKGGLVLTNDIFEVEELNIIALPMADEKELADVGNNHNNNDTILILMWNHYYERKGDDLMSLILTGRKWDKFCCSGRVEVTLDREQLDKAKAVVFFSYIDNLKKKDLPKTRRADQLWVLYAKESPRFSPNLRPFNNLFNWTMSYRRDSEIWAPYGESITIDKPIPVEEIEINGVSLNKWISGKSKLLTGVISHCPAPSKREAYVKLLKSANLTVDIYGTCGKWICNRRNTKCNHTAWWNDLASKYKFYFAAENALCVDYTTEKFWRALEIGIVPVAYGGGNYTLEAPPNSFIDVRDFPSHKELAAYLLHLDGNDDEYRKYFEWRSKYQVRMGEGWQGWCDLCKAVEDYQMKVEENEDDVNKVPQPPHVYSDLQKWWSHMPAPENKGWACSKPQLK